jgi:Uma2 family endonuclease
MQSVLNPSLKEMAQAAINQKLILQGVGWDFYERVLEEFVGSNGIHFAYDDGFLEVEVPLLKHEVPIRLLSDLVSTICVELRISVRNVGSTTFRKRAKSKGCEPDTAFYIQNVNKIRGLEEIDLSKNPPPDLVIDVDVTSPSLNKFPIYAALGVPEIWIYKGEKVEFYKLYGEFYQEIDTSAAFSILSSSKATDFLQSGLTQDYTEWVYSIREWVNKND